MIKWLEVYVELKKIMNFLDLVSYRLLGNSDI